MLFEHLVDGVWPQDEIVELDEATEVAHVELVLVEAIKQVP